VPEDVRARMVGFLGALRAAGAGGGPAPRTGAVAAGGGGGAPAPQLSGAGGPWEFNLRDLLRWCELAEGAAAGAGDGCGPAGPMRCRWQRAGAGAAAALEAAAGRAARLPALQHLPRPPRHGSGAGAACAPRRAGRGAAAAVEAAAVHHARMLFLQRLRTPGDRAALRALFAASWGAPLAEPARPAVALSPRLLTVGRAALPRAGPWACPGARWARACGGWASASSSLQRATAAGVHSRRRCQPGVGMHVLTLHLIAIESSVYKLQRSRRVRCIATCARTGARSFDRLECLVGGPNI
jgi:hypothetical protein